MVHLGGGGHLPPLAVVLPPLKDWQAICTVNIVLSPLLLVSHTFISNNLSFSPLEDFLDVCSPACNILQSSILLIRRHARNVY